MVEMCIHVDHLSNHAPGNCECALTLIFITEHHINIIKVLLLELHLGDQAGGVPEEKMS